MTPEEPISAVHAVDWVDSELRSMVVGYDEAVLEFLLDRPLDRRVEVVVRGYIGIRWIGAWDEVLVDSVSVDPDHPFARETWASLEARGVTAAESGSDARNRRSFAAVVVTFQDGAKLELVGAAGLVRTVAS